MSTPKLNEALLAAQKEMVHPKRTKTNPHFKSKYADLDECWDAWMKAGPKHGLSVSQGGGAGGPANCLRLVTTLRHVSGEEIESVLDIPYLKHDPQAYMAAFTYARRAGLCGITGMVADDDDDGNAAATPPKPAASKPAERVLPGKVSSERTVVTSGGGPTNFPNYGRTKGGAIRGASAGDLDFYAKGAEKSLADASKSRFHAAESALLAAIREEQARQHEAGFEGPPPHTDSDIPF